MAKTLHGVIGTLLACLVSDQVDAQSARALVETRNRMVDEEIVAAGVSNQRVIAAMRNTPRHEFVPLRQRKYAYYDMALPIGAGQTISPPFIVAYMTEQLDPQKEDRVLEVGTGSGYQAAVLSSLVQEIRTIEIVETLGRRAAKTLKRLHCDNVHVRIGDGYHGWPEHAPFDKILVTCSPEQVPAALVRQLREGGLMVVPVGQRYQQNLHLFTKEGGRLVSKALLPTLFVPMTGVAGRTRRLHPDATQPVLTNGSFEDLLGDSRQLGGWHYARQMHSIEDANQARDGRRLVAFRNDDPGRGSQALQGFAVDGRRVAQLHLSLWVQGKDLRPGQTRNQRPRAVVTFYDQSRATVGQAAAGPWLGTFPWKQQGTRLAVPLRAREAILRVGLLGAVGELLVDDISIRAAAQQAGQSDGTRPAE